MELAQRDAVELVSRVDPSEGLKVDAVADLGQVSEVITPLLVEAPQCDVTDESGNDRR